jgi:hypothetical protein
LPILAAIPLLVPLIKIEDELDEPLEPIPAPPVT